MVDFEVSARPGRRSRRRTGRALKLSIRGEVIEQQVHFGFGYRGAVSEHPVDRVRPFGSGVEVGLSAAQVVAGRACRIEQSLGGIGVDIVSYGLKGDGSGKNC